MNEQSSFNRLRHWVEPAHPSIIKFHEDLSVIYRRIRERQDRIDTAFDAAARQIGFVVLTTLPVTLEFAEKGKLKKAALGADYLKGTIWEREFGPIVKGFMSGDPDGSPALAGGDPIPAFEGRYDLPLLWLGALKLKLRTDWVEPAHFRDVVAGRSMSWRPRHWTEPAHFLVGEELGLWAAGPLPDPWLQGAGDLVAGPRPEPWRQRILFSVIDEVYPELRLSDRVRTVVEAARRLRHDWVEPAHFREIERELPQEALAQINEILQRYGRSL